MNYNAERALYNRHKSCSGMGVNRATKQYVVDTALCVRQMFDE